VQIFFFALVVAGTFVAGSLMAALGRAEFDYIKTFFPAIVTLIGTYLGANLAFQFNRRKDAERDLSDHQIAANRAVFAYARQIGELLTIRNNLIDPVRSDPLAFLKMQAHTLERQLPCIDFDSLAFVLSTPHAADVLGQMALAEEMGKTALEMLLDRSRQVMDVSAELARADLQQGPMESLADLKRHAGARRISMLIDATNAFVEQTDAAIERLLEWGPRLQSALQAALPERRVIDFKLD
jgi:hypothetical protein